MNINFIGNVGLVSGTCPDVDADKIRTRYGPAIPSAAGIEYFAIGRR